MVVIFLSFFWLLTEWFFAPHGWWLDSFSIMALTTESLNYGKICPGCTNFSLLLDAALKSLLLMSSFYFFLVLVIKRFLTGIARGHFSLQASARRPFSFKQDSKLWVVPSSKLVEQDLHIVGSQTHAQICGITQVIKNRLAICDFWNVKDLLHVIGKAPIQKLVFQENSCCLL